MYAFMIIIYSRSKCSFAFVGFHLSPCLSPAVAAESVKALTAKIEESLTKTGNVVTRVLEIIDNYNNAPGLGPKLELNTNYEPIPARFRTYQLGESLMNDFTDWSEQKTLAETHYESLSTMTHELLKLNTSQDLKEGMCS